MLPIKAYSNIHDTMIGYTIALPMDYFKKENNAAHYFGFIPMGIIGVMGKVEL